MQVAMDFNDLYNFEALEYYLNFGQSEEELAAQHEEDDKANQDHGKKDKTKIKEAPKETIADKKKKQQECKQQWAFLWLICILIWLTYKESLFRWWLLIFLTSCSVRPFIWFFNFILFRSLRRPEKHWIALWIFAWLLWRLFARFTFIWFKLFLSQLLLQCFDFLDFVFNFVKYF